MPTSYPTALDTTTNLPIAITDATSQATNHPAYHNTEDGALIALEQKLGIGVSTATNGAMLSGSATPGTTTWATGSAGNMWRRGAAGFVASGREFSATAYGVVGDNLNASAGTNSAGLDAAIAAAVAAGEGSAVLLDWTGTAYLNGGHKLYSRIAYIGQGYNKSKLANGRPANTNVYESATFQTLTQTVQASYSVGEYEWLFLNHIIDGNTSNNATGGCGIAAVSYGYYMDGVFIENCTQAGWWSEWTLTTEPMNAGLGSLHQRGFVLGKVHLYNNRGQDRPAANTRLSEGRAAVATGQAALFGPGDSQIDMLMLQRSGTVEAVALKYSNLDFTAGTFTNFDLTIGRLTISGNHAVGIDAIGSNLRCMYLHMEGSYVNIRIVGSGPKLTGKCFNARPQPANFTANTNSSTSLTSVSSTANLYVGMWLTGTGLATGTIITTISGTTITLSIAATATATGVTISPHSTEIAILGAVGNYADIRLQSLDNANSGITYCRLANTSASSLVHAYLNMRGQISGNDTILLAAGSLPTRAEVDILFDDFSGGTAAITPGWIDGPFQSSPLGLANSADVMYRLHYITQPTTLTAGTVTAAAGAATLQAQAGTITSEALVTAVGADYVLVLTNSFIKTTSHVFVSVDNNTNATEGIYVTRVTPGSGAVTIRVRNGNTGSALNGSIKLNFFVVN